MNNIESDTQTYSAFVALIGAPNAGKSTLLNQLVGTKISIVTHKVQTTRTIIRGIVSTETHQVIFLDTPGLFKPKSSLDNMMVSQAWGGAKEADIITLLIDAKLGLNQANQAILEKIKNFKQPKILILNKIDLIKHEELLKLTKEISDKYQFEHIFMLSALKGEQVQDYLNTLYKMLPKGPFYYDPEHASTIALRELAAEITREKIYLRVHEELPYSAAVQTEKYEELKDGSIRIDQVIYVERDGQKKIILGKQGSIIKNIGKTSREELSELLDRKVHLFLYVKVQPNWKSKPEEYCSFNPA